MLKILCLVKKIFTYPRKSIHLYVYGHNNMLIKKGLLNLECPSIYLFKSHLQTYVFNYVFK